MAHLERSAACLHITGDDLQREMISMSLGVAPNTSRRIGEGNEGAVIAPRILKALGERVTSLGLDIHVPTSDE
ncbi:MAG TPA: hypothetical protein VGF12_22710 [Roseateles sp.]|uniref:hypothetical protein n=1 Tax=Roseateles sp. TaxID=1971397 RepID=UPI002EDB3C23